MNFFRHKIYSTVEFYKKVPYTTILSYNFSTSKVEKKTKIDKIDLLDATVCHLEKLGFNTYSGIKCENWPKLLAEPNICLVNVL